MQPPGKSVLVRELLWLLGILVAAVPLALGLHQLARRVPSLQASFPPNLPTLAQFVLLYVLAVLSCYLLRLGVAGAGRIATVVAID